MRGSRPAMGMVLALWLMSTASFVYAEAPDPEAAVCRRDGSARAACGLPWLATVQLENVWTVELVWDADGFGSPGAKIYDYEQYCAETGFEMGGFKIYYEHDTPLLTPPQVMALEPIPSIIIYQ